MGQKREVLEVEYKSTTLGIQLDALCINCFKQNYSGYHQKSGNTLATIKIQYRYHRDTNSQRHAYAKH